ncbi:hypothetical protein RFI_25760, partial [Reticulomyxa filosa]
MKMENEELKSMVHMKEHDLKLLTKDNALLNELYEEEKTKYEAELLKLEKLKQEMVEKEAEFELHTREQEMFGGASKKPGGSGHPSGIDEEDHRHADGYDDEEEEESGDYYNSNAHGHRGGGANGHGGYPLNGKSRVSAREYKKLHEELQEERRRGKELKEQLNNVLNKLEDEEKTKEELEQLKEYCNKLEQLNSQQLDDATAITQSVHNEIVKLAHRNAHLEQEKQDLVKHLDAKHYEIAMLQKSLALSHYENGPMASSSSSSSSAHQQGRQRYNDGDGNVNENTAIADDIYNARKNELLRAFDELMQMQMQI